MQAGFAAVSPRIEAGKQERLVARAFLVSFESEYRSRSLFFRILIPRVAKSDPWFLSQIFCFIKGLAKT
jgi:hypothetical protein